MEYEELEKKIHIFLALIIGAFLVLVIRVAYLQLVEVDRYRTQAQQNHQRVIPIKPPRGEIFDRNGLRMVGNRPEYTVLLTYLGLKNTERIVNVLSELMVHDKEFEGKDVEQVKQELQEKIKEKKLRLYEPVQVANGISLETVTKIEEHRIDLPGVVIDVEPVRDYPMGDLMAPVLGYVREINEIQLEEHKNEGYQMGDEFGQTGIENQYEKFLRGKKGGRIVEVDALGRPVRDLGVKPPVPGNSLVLTVDSRLQKVAQDALARGIARAENYVKGSKLITASAVVLDVNTGEILAMVSLPAYDPVIFTKELSKEEFQSLQNKGALSNHAVQTLYIPGSTFKMVTATALLEGGIVQPETTIFCSGYYKYKKDWKPGGHGRLNVVRAIKVSCDVFFYMFGAKSGPELMGKYAKEYGLGEKTGVDLPREVPGQVPSRELKRKRWQGNAWEANWHEYDSMDMAIGQQENKYTAIQLANYIAVIANGGKLFRPYIVKKIVSPERKTIKEFSPYLKRRAKISMETLEIVREGMHEVTLPPDGTASYVFAGTDYEVAAKTGTAEVGDREGNTHALFLAYAPYEKPEVAVSVVIGYGGKGSGVAGPVAREILDAYFKHRTNST